MDSPLLQSLCVQANEIATSPGEAELVRRHKLLVSNIKGVFFYSTPSTGSDLAGHLFVRVLRATGFLGRPVDCLTRMNRATLKLRSQFDKLRQDKKWKKAAVGEAHATKVTGKTMVECASVLGSLPVCLHVQAAQHQLCCC